MPPRIFWLLIIVSICASTGCHSTETKSMSDDAAKKLINGNFGTPAVAILIGDVKYWDKGEWDTQNHAVPLDQLAFAHAMAREGYVSVTNERDLTAGFQGWGDWFALTQSGIKKTATVNPTERATRDPRFRTTDGQLQWTTARMGVKELVENQTFEGNGNRYALVSAVLSTIRVDEELLRIYESFYGPSQDMKVRMLLKFDPFAKKWVTEVTDIAFGGEPFTSHGVEAALSAVQAR